MPPSLGWRHGGFRAYSSAVTSGLRIDACCTGGGARDGQIISIVQCTLHDRRCRAAGTGCAAICNACAGKPARTGGGGRSAARTGNHAGTLSPDRSAAARRLSRGRGRVKSCASARSIARRATHFAAATADGKDAARSTGGGCTAICARHPTPSRARTRANEKRR